MRSKSVRRQVNAMKHDTFDDAVCFAERIEAVDRMMEEEDEH